MSKRPVIIGGGPAGSAAAIALARAGAEPLLIERDAGPLDAVCGGFLSWRTLEQLKALGLSVEALGGQTVRRVRLFAGGRQAEARLPESGMGLSRQRLDALMLDTAGAVGTEIRRGVAVRAVESGAAILAGGERIEADAIFLASGKYGLPGLTRHATGRAAADHALGLRLVVPPSPVLPDLVGDAVELHLFDGGYAGIVRQETGRLNIAIATHKSALADAGGQPWGLLARWADQSPDFAARLERAAPNAAQIDAIGAVPYGWMARTGSPGLWRLGDQAACIPSLAGEGMGIAIASATSAVAAWRQGLDSGHWQAEFARRLSGPMRIATPLWRAAETPALARLAVRAISIAPQLVRQLGAWTRVSP